MRDAFIIVCFVAFLLILIVFSTLFLLEFRKNNVTQNNLLEIHQKQYDEDTSFHNFQKEMYEELQNN